MDFPEDDNPNHTAQPGCLDRHSRRPDLGASPDKTMLEIHPRGGPFRSCGSASQPFCGPADQSARRGGDAESPALAVTSPRPNQLPKRIWKRSRPDRSPGALARRARRMPTSNPCRPGIPPAAGVRRRGGPGRIRPLAWDPPLRRPVGLSRRPPVLTHPGDVLAGLHRRGIRYLRPGFR